jgi:hypothetical protein
LNEDDLFPIEVGFQGNKCWFEGKVLGVTETDGKEVGWEVDSKISSDNFKIN